MSSCPGYAKGLTPGARQFAAELRGGGHRVKMGALLKAPTCPGGGRHAGPVPRRSAPDRLRSLPRHDAGAAALPMERVLRVPGRGTRDHLGPGAVDGGRPAPPGGPASANRSELGR